MSLPDPTAPEVLGRLRQAAVSAESEAERLERERRMTEWMTELLLRLHAERSARQRRRTRWSVGAVGLSLAAAWVALYLGRWDRPSPSLGLATVTLVSGTVVKVNRAGDPVPSYAGQRLEDGDRIRVGDGQGALLLRNGARARLAASTSLTLANSGRLPNEERLALELGTAAFVVPKLAAGRTLTVVTAQVEVRVVGTRFSVTADNGGKGVSVRSCVAVSEGRVRLRRGTAERELGAGQEWSSDGRRCSNPQSGGAADARLGATPRETPLSKRLPPPVSVSEPSVEPSGPPQSGAWRSHAPGPSASDLPAAPRATVSEPSTLSEQNRLFLQAVRARRSGDPARAIELLSELIAHYPNTPLLGEAQRELTVAEQARARQAEERKR